MNKKDMSERDICTKYITPALLKAGWDIQLQIMEEVNLTKGRVIVRGNLHTRAKNKRADYILYYKPNIPIAIIEAKDNNHTVGDGMQQALSYAEICDVPFVFSSNGDAFLFHNKLAKDGKIEKEVTLDKFPSPLELWQQYCESKRIDKTQEAIITQDYYVDGSGKAPRYYYTAFQIIWRLWKSKARKRILFLVDRNILADQTKTNDFKPFGSVMTKIKKRQADKSYEIYLSLYQAVTGTEEEQNIYKQFSPDFFDLVIIDECHRGSAKEDSNWRAILEYFTSATQIGLTATPKETKEVSNIHYFGDPLYTYSLKQGIEDGFLAPYKVVRIDIDKDLAGWRPEKGKRDKYGNEIEDRIYNQSDLDKKLILEKRTELVAQKISEFLKATNRYDKTIVFCENIDHAERMRQALVNENFDLAAENDKYVMRITGDNEEGKAELDNFINPESIYPVIATTSKLMSTGVDAQTCKLIVLDQTIQSMTEFKQIIGRGTRINEDYDKFYFTIMDFKKATELFADPDFDGDPVQIHNPGPDDPPVPPDDITDDPPEDSPEPTIIDIFPNGGDEPPGVIYRFVVDDVPVKVIAERVQYYGKDGRLMTESLKDYTKNTITKEFKSLNDFLKYWSDAEKKDAIIHELESHGIFFEALKEEVGKDYDPFDMICHIAWGQPPLTRRERANNVKKRDSFTKYGVIAKKVLDALLDKYADQGIKHIEGFNVLTIQPLSAIGTPKEIVDAFGGKDNYVTAVHELEQELYRISA
ncbi:DEAD/DEAH box helicase family protein [Candidatus Desantisbacteria bacterium]|nr:DEAD/DEAH box helicase family protein [Candidatus Desantisbacteria bacterium]